MGSLRCGVLMCSSVARLFYCLSNLPTTGISKILYASGNHRTRNCWYCTLFRWAFSGEDASPEER